MHHNNVSFQVASLYWRDLDGNFWRTNELALEWPLCTPGAGHALGEPDSQALHASHHQETTMLSPRHLTIPAGVLAFATLGFVAACSDSTAHGGAPLSLSVTTKPQT